MTNRQKGGNEMFLWTKNKLYFRAICFQIMSIAVITLSHCLVQCSTNQMQILPNDVLGLMFKQLSTEERWKLIPYLSKEWNKTYWNTYNKISKKQALEEKGIDTSSISCSNGKIEMNYDTGSNKSCGFGCYSQ